MSYAGVDQILRAWSAANVKELFVEWGGEEARFCYLSSPQGECYQISVDPPENDLVRIHVRAIETLDDMKAHLEWYVSVPDLEAALDAAKVTLVECLWRRRPLKPE